MESKKPKTVEEVAEERDRYIARNAELEARLDQMRQISLGLVAERLAPTVDVTPAPPDLTIKQAQAEQPWQGAYAKGVMLASQEDVPHILGAHNALHVAKTAGKLAAVFEELEHPADEYTDHGAVMSDAQRQVVKDMSADLVTEALRFANLYAFDLETELRRRVAKQNPAPKPATTIWLRFDANEFPKYARKCTGKARALPFGALPFQDMELTMYDIVDKKLITLGLFLPGAGSPGPHKYGPEFFQQLAQWLEIEVKS